MESIKSKIKSMNPMSASSSGDQDTASNCQLLSARGELRSKGSYRYFLPARDTSGYHKYPWVDEVFVTPGQQSLKTLATDYKQYTKSAPPVKGGREDNTVVTMAFGREFTNKPTEAWSAPGFVLSEQSDGGCSHRTFQGGLVRDTAQPWFGPTNEVERNEATVDAIRKTKRSVHVTQSSSSIPKTDRKNYSQLESSNIEILSPSEEVPGLKQLYYQDGTLSAVYDYEEAKREMAKRQSSASENAGPQPSQADEKRGNPGTSSSYGQYSQSQSR